MGLCEHGEEADAACEEQAQAEPVDSFEVALYGYGTPPGQQLAPLTTDLDMVSQQLFGVPQRFLRRFHAAPPVVHEFDVLSNPVVNRLHAIPGLLGVNADLLGQGLDSRTVAFDVRAGARVST